MKIIIWHDMADHAETENSQRLVSKEGVQKMSGKFYISLK